MTKDEALTMALEALENAKLILIGLQTIGIKAGATSQAMRLGEQFIQDRAITAIKKALAQPAQFNPDYNTEAVLVEEMQRMAKRIEELEALAQSQRKPLTHEQRLDLLAAFEPSKTSWNAESILIDMVEAAHGIKENT